MAKSLKELTRLGTDARKIAALLREKAPSGHDLAWINPREAALLKASGGSGHIDPQTGIQSFQEAPLEDFGPPPDFEEAPGYSTEGYAGAPEVITPAAQQYYGAPTAPIEQAEITPRSFVRPTDVMAPGAAQIGMPTPTAPQPVLPDVAYQTGEFAPAVPAAPAAPAAAAPAPAAPAAKGKDNLLAQLGIAGITGLLGARGARRATAAGQQAKTEMQQLASPYQQTGQQLQAAAQRGELTPAGMQSLQAAQAQLAQGVEARGGVGVAQAQQAITNLRQQLLQQQYDYGLKLSGIGDQIALGAIRTGMQADQAANQLTNQYFSNIARIATPALVGQ